MQDTMNKKAMSNIVASVFLILIGIISVTIVYTSISGLTAKLSPELSCSQLNINPPIIVSSACFNSDANKIEAKLERPLTDSTQISSLRFRASLSNGNEAAWECGDSCQGSHILSPGESLTYYLDDLNAEEIPENLIININSCPTASKEISSC